MKPNAEEKLAEPSAEKEPDQNDLPEAWRKFYQEIKNVMKDR